MSRREELLNCFKDVSEEKRLIVSNLIDEFLFLEEQLEALRKKPMIKTHPKDKQRVKPTESAKLYKELLQQYTNAAKILLSLQKNNDEKTQSPLRAYLERLSDD